jgi:ATP-binding cassette subfamily B protein
LTDLHVNHFGFTSNPQKKMSDSNYNDIPDAFEDYDPNSEGESDSDNGFDHSQFDDPIDSEIEVSENPESSEVIESIVGYPPASIIRPENNSRTDGDQSPSEEPFIESGQDAESVQNESFEDSNDGVIEEAVVAEDPADQETKIHHTALKCLGLIARHHGFDVSADRLIHDYSLENEEPTLRRVLRIAKDSGFKAKHVRLTWKQLRKMDQAFPAMARLQNGNYVIMVGLRKIEDEDGTPTEQIAVFDPMADNQGFMYLKQEQFEKSWKGETILTKKTFSMMDMNQPFSLKWFIPEILKQRTAFTDVAVAALFIHLIALVVPLFFQIVIDKVLVNSALETLRVLTIGICAALMFDAVLGYLRSFLLLHATSKIDIRVATRTFGHMLRLPMSYFEHTTAGVLTKHMQQTNQIREFLTGSLFLTMLDSTALLIFLPILWFYSVPLTIVVLMFSLALAINIGVLLGPYRRRLEALYNAEGDRQAMLVESIHGIQTVKALSMEPVQRKAWDEKSAKSVAMQYRVGKISITATTISKFLEKMLTVVVVWYGASLVIGKQISVGELVAFQMISGRVTGPLVQLVGLVHSYQQCALSVRMLGSVMNHNAEAGIGQGLRPQVRGHLEFENVTFSYAPTSPPALDRVSFEVPEGKIVGIVGRSGSGKTTLTRMLQGMHQPQSGIIRIDKLDMRELDIAHLRQNIGVVLQDNFLFRGTVRENIAMAKPNSTFPEVVYMARMAGAAEFIERMPQSYDTMLEENGSNLSGGQKQRLAIARALLKDPRILIFDEATSALDPESEAIIQRNLKKIAEGRTVFMVSHRLSTLTDCDAIIVLERGEIDSMGTHQQLLQKSKVYKDLWHQQMGRV